MLTFEVQSRFGHCDGSRVGQPRACSLDSLSPLSPLKTQPMAESILTRPSESLPVFSGLLSQDPGSCEALNQGQCVPSGPLGRHCG